MTILERIKNNTDGVLDNPSLLSEYLVLLASNIGDADKQKVIAEVEYAKRWSEVRKTTESDKAADMKMKLTEEYLELRSKESLVKVLLETIRAVKHRIKFLGFEYSELTR